MTSTIQFLCFSMPETLLHMTLALKRRAEIMAEFLARLLLCFCWSYKNLTIIGSIYRTIVTFLIHLGLEPVLVHVSLQKKKVRF